MNNLAELRKSIDRLDDRIVSLLNQRARLALDVSRQKRRKNLPIFAPDRESKLLQRVAQLGKNGPLASQSLRAIYREIISASVALQSPLKIAFFGAEASFTHQAARQQFGSLAAYDSVKSIADVFREVERGRVDYGVVPVENSTEGVVSHTLDMFAESGAKICAEISMPISENLLSVEPSLSGIRKVFSHPQPLGQCRLWLNSHLPEAELVEVSSTSQAAKLAARTPRTAAIASRLAANLYGLKILATGIEDAPDNRTRFLVLGRQCPGPSGHDKTSLQIAIKDSVGALFKILQPFARHRLNLTGIESRPSRLRPWNYLFYIDCEGHVEEKRLQQALQALKPLASAIKVLGSYPRGEESRS